MLGASSGSTPMILISGRRYLVKAAIPAASPPPPIGTKIALDRIGMLAQDLHADRALPGDDLGVVRKAG